MPVHFWGGGGEGDRVFELIDHAIWYSPISDRHFVVDSMIKSKHTANAVLKQAGLSKGF
jgi:hypothetical protein